MMNNILREAISQFNKAQKGSSGLVKAEFVGMDNSAEDYINLYIDRDTDSFTIPDNEDGVIALLVFMFQDWLYKKDRFEEKAPKRAGALYKCGGGYVIRVYDESNGECEDILVPKRVYEAFK